MVSSSNYAVVKQDVNLNYDEECDESIFDNLINNFISDSEADNTDQLLPEHDSPTTLPSSDASEPTFEDSMSIQNDAAADLHIPSFSDSKEIPSFLSSDSILSDVVTPINFDDPTQLPLEPIDNVESSSPTPQTPSTLDVVFTEESSSTHTSNINTSTTAINLPVTHEQLHAKKFYSSNPTLRGSKDTE